MSKLKLVQPHPEPNVNVFLYGLPKTGKTMGAASAPKPMLYLNADSPNATRYAHSKYEFDEVHVEGLETLVDVTTELEKGTKYRTVVLDTIGETYRTLLEEMSNDSLHKQLQQYGDTGTHLERFCRKLVSLPVNVVFVAHEGEEVKNDATGEVEHLPFVTTQSGSPVFAAKLMAVVDVIGYTGVVKEPKGEAKYVAQLINGGGRRGGDRFGVLGDNREMNLTEWVELAREASKPKKTTQPKAA